MDLNTANHPCFNDKARHAFGRVHLPVAPGCNIQCNFCNRKFDCVNESRPGVSSGLLSPDQAMRYLDEVFRRKPNIAVVGIAGPGDPFANADRTMETLRLVRGKYPQMLLCVATNGLCVGPHLNELADLKVSHVTVTVNAVDPAIAERIYAWVREGKCIRGPREGAEILLTRQEEAIRGLKERGITTKVNTIVIPGVNDGHVEAVARRMAGLGVDILNIIPYYRNDGANFAHIPEPSAELVRELRAKAGAFLPMMHHCTRCRADAVGLLGESISQELTTVLQACSAGKSADSTRPFVAVASTEGVMIDEHLGQAARLLIFEHTPTGPKLRESRPTPEKGGGIERWEGLAELLKDCRGLMAAGIGATPRRVLAGKGIAVHQSDGPVLPSVDSLFKVGLVPESAGVACEGGCSP
jgi:nitrogen fixation protein NifB